MTEAGTNALRHIVMVVYVEALRHIKLQSPIKIISLCGKCLKNSECNEVKKTKSNNNSPGFVAAENKNRTQGKIKLDLIQELVEDMILFFYDNIIAHILSEADTEYVEE